MQWRNILSINNCILPSFSHFSAFHSSPCSCLKWNPSPRQIRKGQPFKKNSKMRGTFSEDSTYEFEDSTYGLEDSQYYEFGFEDSTYGFEDSQYHDFVFEDWTHMFKWTRTNTNKWNTGSVGSSSKMHNYRTILGLPPTGPLKIEDVKAAFRLSALKWHPDKHQGSSKAMAEEKFKLCVNAYETLCNALSPG